MSSGGFELQGGFWSELGGGAGPCTTHGDCADLDDNGVRDDNCVFWACASGTCADTAIVFADMGGPFGACPPDGAADGNDRFHALNCFSNTTTTGQVGYPCEDSPPAAFNVDAGGSFGSCSPDGVCDGNDAFHALNAFQGTTICSCSGPAPAPAGPPIIAGEARLALIVDRASIAPNDVAEVDVILTHALEDLRGYQLHVGVSGGIGGRLDLIDIAIRQQSALGSDADGRSTREARSQATAFWSAFNVGTRQMVAGLDQAGVSAQAGAYLATFVFRASPDAIGEFTVELLHDEKDATNRTFLFPTAPGAKIEIVETQPAVIEVSPAQVRAGKGQ
jgi:hypothetical protein